MHQPKPPTTKSRREQLITQWQKDSGQPVARLNLRIAALMLAGALARVTDHDGQDVFATMGGMAMEPAARRRAPATRDVDIVIHGNPEDLSELLDASLRAPYQGFASRRGTIGAGSTRSGLAAVSHSGGSTS